MKLLLLAFILLLGAVSVQAQVTSKPIVFVTADPSVCAGDKQYNNTTSGDIFERLGSSGSTCTKIVDASGGTPAGSNTQVQFNDSASFGGSSGFTFNKTSMHGALGPAAIIDNDLFGIGTTGQIIFNVAQNVTSIPNDFFYGHAVSVNLNPSPAPVSLIAASNIQMQVDVASTVDFNLSEVAAQNLNFIHHGTGEMAVVRGQNTSLANYSTGTFTVAEAGGFTLSQPHAGTIVDGNGLSSSVNQDNGTWTRAKGLSIALTKSGGTMGDFTGIHIAATVNAPITTAQGIIIDDLSAIGTTSFNIWSKGATAVNKFEGNVSAATYSTATNCADSAGAAACGSAAAGSVVMDAAATTVVVSTTAVTANSQIFIQEDSSLNTRLSVTCNTVIARDYVITARTAGTSFTVTSSAAPVTNPACLSFKIVN